MIVTKKFVFIHMHKTGGQSINTIITKCIPDYEFIGYHFPRKSLPKKYVHLPLIAVVRNPWDWYVSWFAFNNKPEINNPLFYVLSDGGLRDFKGTITNLLNLGSDSLKSQQYRRALSGVLPETLKGNEGVGLTKADIRQFNDNNLGYLSWLFKRMHGEFESDRRMVCRFENLQDDFLSMMSDLSVQETDAMTEAFQSTSRLNSSKHNHYSDYYDDELQKLVLEKDKYVVGEFGYQFENMNPNKESITFENLKVNSVNGEFRKLLGRESNFLAINSGFDVEPLKKKLLAVPESLWRLSQREKTFKIHKHTQALRLVYDEDFRHYNPTMHPLLAEFQNELTPLLELIANYYNHNGFIIRLIFAKLTAKGKIPAHFDLQYSLMNCHRIHIPIITNEKSVFYVGGEEKVMQVGEVWEINNATVHEVHNRGDEDRVHLIIDWAPHSTVRDIDKKSGVVKLDTPEVKSNEFKDTKIGRNEPCPCGSGKKYKKCHG